MELSKETIRQQNISARTSINVKDWTKKSAIISELLEEVLDWSKLKRVHIYEPISTLGEVNIMPFVKYLSDNYPEIELYTSRQFVDIWHVVKLGGAKKVDAPRFQAAIVPMLGFDA